MAAVVEAYPNLSNLLSAAAAAWEVAKHPRNTMAREVEAGEVEVESAVMATAGATGAAGAAAEGLAVMESYKGEGEGNGHFS